MIFVPDGFDRTISSHDDALVWTGHAGRIAREWRELGKCCVGQMLCWSNVVLVKCCVWSNAALVKCCGVEIKRLNVVEGSMLE